MNDENRIEMVEARTAFKRSVQHFRYECKNKKQKRLLYLKYNRILEVIKEFTIL